MKKGKKKISIATLVISIAVALLVGVIVLVCKSNSSISNFLLGNREKVNAGVWINSNGKDSNVQGEIIIGGSSNNWYYNGKYRNGYCVNNGASLWGGESTLDNKGSAYINNHASSTENKKKLNWLFDNIARFNLSGKNSSGTDVTDKLEKVNLGNELNFYKENLKAICMKHGLTEAEAKKSAGIGSGSLSDEEIFQVQQYVIWHYTKNTNSKPTIKSGDKRYNLYKALIDEADTHSGYNGTGKDVIYINQGKVNGESYNVKKGTNNKELIIGPIEIKSNATAKPYKIEIGNLSITNNSVKSYKIIKNHDKKEISNNSIADYKGNIWIYVTLKNDIKVNTEYSVSGNVKISYYDTEATYWQKTGLQEVVTLNNREPKSGSLELEGKYYEAKKDVDLALKKAIVEVQRDGQSVYSGYFKGENNYALNIKNEFTNKDGEYSRYFSIDSSGLDKETVTTAKYNMKKDPIKVKKGDIVTYSITIFNEGNIPATASEITDYLPAGLELDLDTDMYPIRYGKTTYADTSGNKEHPYGYELITESGVDTIKIKCLKDEELIKPYGTQGRSLMYYGQTVYVRCKVKNDATGVLTNVSEITKYKYNAGDGVVEIIPNSPILLKDRDSTVANWRSPSKNTEYKTTSDRSTDAWRNYSNDKEINSSYKDYGAQNKDDDDFDKVEVVEDYNVVLKKVDSSNNKLPGVEFNVAINNGKSEKYTTNEDSIIELPAQTLNKEEIDKYSFEEINVGNNSGYVKLKDKFELYVKKELKDGISYQITGFCLKNASDELSNNAYKTEDSTIKLKDENENIVTVKAKFEKILNQITLEVTNNKSLKYDLNLEKVDKNDESKYLAEARFTIDGPDGNIITNESLRDGKLTITNNNITLNTMYEYTIEETSPETSYKNVFENYKIKVNIYVNSDGKIDEVKSYVNIIPKDGTTADSIKEAEASDSVYLKVDPDNDCVAKLVMKNPKVEKSMKLSLYKHNNSYGVDGAVFNLYNSNENANELDKVNTITTKSTNSRPEVQELISKDGLTIGTTYYYILEEESVPQNYVSVFEKALIKVQLQADEVVKYTIEKVYKDGTWYNYIESDNEAISIDASGVIRLENPIEYNFNMYKKKYTENKEIAECDPFDKTVRFKVEQIYPSTEEIKPDGELENAMFNFENKKAKANSTYKYKITETNVSDEYYDTLVNKSIIVTVRTDEKGNIKKESYEGSNWEFDSELNLTEEQKTKLSSLIKMKIDGNSINFYIANMPKNYYSLQLIKVDEKGKKIEERETEFYISQTSTNADTSGFEIGTESKGKSTTKGVLDVVSGLTIESGYTHNYVIKETKEPVGYSKLLGNIEVRVKFTADGKLLDENITCKYVENGVETELVGLKKHFEDGNIPTIQIYIPNKADLFEFELAKEDFSGNKIKSDILENGNVDGPKFKVSLENVFAVGATNVPEGTNFSDFGGINFDGVLENGAISGNIVAYNNLKYIFTVEEISAKSGYMNVLDGYGLTITVTTNGESKIESVVYQVINLKDHNRDVTEEFKAKYGNYLDIYKEETKEKVVVKVKNSTGYKVRLNKVDTVNNPVKTAYIEGILNNEIKCSLNIARNPITGEVIYTSGNSSATSYEMIKIAPGETQVWKVYERGVDSPYVNVFDRKYIEVTVKMDDSGVLSVLNYTIKNDDESDLTQEELTKLRTYIRGINFINEDGTNILNITLKNPFKYKFKLIKTEADENYTPLAGAELKVNGKTVIQNGETTYETECSEVSAYEMRNFEVEEISAPNGRCNVLDGKVLIINTRINYEGKIDYYNHYIKDKETGSIISKSDEIYKYISVKPLNIENGNAEISTLQVMVQNPIEFNFELYKADSNGNKLDDAKFEISSEILKEQKGRYFDKDLTVGVDKLDILTGTICGTTESNEDGAKISFKETYVSTNRIYEYKLKETKVPGSEYVNILKDYNLFVKVKVAQNGTISLENYENGKNCIIKNEAGEADAKYYEYVKVIIENNTVKVQVINPNKIKIELNKKLFGKDNINLHDVKFEVDSSISDKRELATSYYGDAIFDEEFININEIYEYNIREVEVPGAGVINILDNYYIKVRIKVKPDGTMTTVNKREEETTNTYEIYKLDGETYTNIEVNFEDTNIDKYIQIDTSKKISNIPVLNIKVTDPQKYGIKLFKQDVDTDEYMNDVTFNITVLDKDNNEIKLKDIYTLENIDLTNVKTSTVDGQNGVIQINNILFEKAEEFTLKIQENKVDGFKQIPDIYAKVYVDIVNGIYSIKDIKVTQGKEFTNISNTRSARTR